MSIKYNSVDLSIVITAHKEGILAHKTILSILRGLESFEENNLTFEIIIHIDNGDADTIEYYKRYASDGRFRIFNNSFGNPADSRNYGINKAQGVYTTLLDGDDLISKNWLVDGVQLLKQTSEPTILRPQYHFHFGVSEELNDMWIMDESFTKEEDALIMAFYNRWSLPLIAKTSLLKSYPFKPSLNGYAYEDWLFNADIRSDGIAVRIVKGAVLFYRRRRESVTSLHRGGILEYSNLFDIDFIKSIKIPPESIKRKAKLRMWSNTAKEVSTQVAKSLRYSNRIRKITDPMLQSVLYKKRNAKLSPMFIEAWKDINSIENQLYPTKSAVRSISFHPLSFNQYDTRYGIIYKRLAEQITAKPDYLFLPPELGVGGTEKLLFNYIDALSVIHPGWRIAVIGKPHRDYVKSAHSNVDFIDFFGLTSGLSKYEKDILWSRLLVQMEVKKLHIINNDWFYEWISDHQNLLIHEKYTVNASMFMREYTEEANRIRSYADPLLTDIYPVINKVFTDNQNIINEMLGNNAFDPAKLITHYQPESSTVVPVKKIEPQKPLRILWAGRLSKQKRPDLLKSIGQHIDNKKFHIDVYGTGSHYDGATYFKDTKAITYKGAFSGVNSIPTEKYDAFLYTSSVDGLPNILLEIASKGLPIVASDDGGVSEFILHESTGLLVDIEDIKGYVDALNLIRENPEKSKAYAEESQKLLKSRHSFDEFLTVVKRDL